MQVLAFGSQSPSKTLHPNSEVGDIQDCFPIQLELNQKCIGFFEHFFIFVGFFFYRSINFIDVLIYFWVILILHAINNMDFYVCPCMQV